MGNTLLNKLYDLSDGYTQLEGKILKGSVKVVSDPLHLSRVRVSIPKLTDNIQDEQLPWAFPLNGLRGQEYPKVDETVGLICASEDLSSIFWFRWPGNKDFESDNLHGFVDNYGSLFCYDSESGDYIFNHKDGSYIQMTKDKTTIVAKNIEIKAQDNIKIVSKTYVANGDTATNEYNTSISNTTNTINNTAGMINDSTSGSPNADTTVELKIREEQTNEA